LQRLPNVLQPLLCARDAAHQVWPRQALCTRWQIADAADIAASATVFLEKLLIAVVVVPRPVIVAVAVALPRRDASVCPSALTKLHRPLIVR
jgi:hypothetical protein